MRPVFVLDVSELAIDLLSRERFIDDYCNVLTANGRSLPEMEDEDDQEAYDRQLYLAAVTEIQKDPDIRIADTSASLTTLISQYYKEALRKAQTVQEYEKAAKRHLELLNELSAVLRKLASVRREEASAVRKPVIRKEEGH